MSDRQEIDKTPSGSGGSVAAGVALILAGLIFLLRNVTGWQLNNWWALFILVPAVFLLANAFRLYQADRRFTGRVTQAATGATFMLLVALVFLLGLDWSAVWPVFLIIGGVAALSSSARRG